MPPDPGTGPRNAGFLQTIRAVLWSFLGVRKRSGYEQDATQLNPVVVIIAGVITASPRNSAAPATPSIRST